MKFFAKTHTGNVRSINEDCLYIPKDASGIFAVVADGMGGHNAGEVASRIVVDTITNVLSDRGADSIDENAIRGAVDAANIAVWKDADQDLMRHGMGSTVTIAVFARGKAIICQVGDSRAYLLRGGIINQITKDHSYVQMLVDNGSITTKEALVHPQRNIITRAVGTEKVIETDIYEIPYENGDIFMLCTDGLSGIVRDADITRIIVSGDIDSAVDRLVNAALEAGGHDNISVVIAEMGGELNDR